MYYTEDMKKEKLVKYFADIETIQAYNWHFCSISEALNIVVLGSIRGLHTVNQIHQ